MKFWGKVKKGKGRGKDLGFPTANINLHKKIPEGVFVSITKIKKDKFPSLTFVGSAKTFNENIYHAESFLLGFKDSLHGKYVSINLLKRIRDNQRFKTVKSLISQIKKDERTAWEYFNRKSIDKSRR